MQAVGASYNYNVVRQFSIAAPVLLVRNVKRAARASHASARSTATKEPAATVATVAQPRSTARRGAASGKPH